MRIVNKEDYKLVVLRLPSMVKKNGITSQEKKFKSGYICYASHFSPHGKRILQRIIMAESKNCEVCGKEFHSKNIRFCGLICWIKKQTKWIRSVTNCEECGVEFEYKKPTTPRKRKSLRRYCSKECNTSTSFWINITPEQALNRLRFLFEKRVVKKDGCWEWIGSKTKKYPLIFSGFKERQ